MKTTSIIMVFVMMIVILVTVYSVIQNGPIMTKYFMRIPAFAVLYFGGNG
ncbi:MAG: hypothetical protein GOV00_04175 [Candidatus Altiarchaeota archaeon]|nr:hypothetical protein [Candidatus Altiarchaeota archaeon]